MFGTHRKVQKKLRVHSTEVEGAHMLRAAVETAGICAAVGLTAAAGDNIVVACTAGEGREEGRSHQRLGCHIHDLPVGGEDKRQDRYSSWRTSIGLLANLGRNRRTHVAAGG